MALGNLVVKMLADIKDMKNKLDGYEKKIDQAKTTTEKFAKGVQNSFKTFIKFGAILGGAYLAIRKLTSFLKSSLDAYGAQEEAITKLNAALIATSRYTPQVSDEMQKYASEMQKLTKFSDDQITAAQAILTTFTKIGTDTFPEVTEAAMNMSAMFGQDLQQSMIQLGTALNDPIQGVGRLRRIGISFTEEQKELIRALVEQNDLYGAQRVILDELQVEIGGTARAIGEEYAGRVAQLKNAFVDLKETMGFFMAESMTPMMPKIQSMVESIDGWLKVKRELIEVYEDLAKAGKKSIEELSQAEIEATIKTLWRDKEKLEIRMKEIQATGTLNIEQKKQLIAYGQLIQKIKELANKLAMEVQITDELREKYDFLAPPKKKDAELTGEIIKLTHTTTEEMEYLEQALGYVGNIIAGNFAPNLTYGKYALDQLDIALMNINLDLDDTADKVKEFLQTYMAGIVAAQSITQEFSMTFEEFSNAFNEWALQAEEKINRVTGITSLGVNAIDNVYSQMFTNRRIELDNWAYNENEALNNWYNERLQAIENMNITDEERIQLLKNLETERTIHERTINEAVEKKRRQIARDEAKANKQIAIINAIMNTAQAVVKAWSQGGFFFGGFMAAFVAAMGARQIALIKAQPLPALAEGGELITNGPQYVLVGDNPGGRELVQATPLSSPNINGPNQMFRVVVNIGDGFYETLYDKITKATEDGAINVHIRSLKDW